MQSSQNKIRIGLMGFGRTGRQLYYLASTSSDIEIPVICDRENPEILAYLLRSEGAQYRGFQLQGNYLLGSQYSSRVLQGDDPAKVPWDIFGVDVIVDLTRKNQSATRLQALVGEGSPKVIFSGFPGDSFDRVVIPGFNQAEIQPQDRTISAGSATTTAALLILDILNEAYGIRQAALTSVHAYTSDQPAQDYAGRDFRRSRAAAENIIPNTMPAVEWVPRLMPALQDRLCGFTLNVPVSRGSLLDLDIDLSPEGLTTEEINASFRAAAENLPGILATTEDPVVSSDIRDMRFSALIDLKSTQRCGNHLVKILAWYDTSGHAARLLDVVRLYSNLDEKASHAHSN